MTRPELAVFVKVLVTVRDFPELIVSFLLLLMVKLFATLIKPVELIVTPSLLSIVRYPKVVAPLEISWAEVPLKVTALELWLMCR